MQNPHSLLGLVFSTTFASLLLVLYIKKVGNTMMAYFVWMPARQFGTFYNGVVAL